jgi:hypothetical protein
MALRAITDNGYLEPLDDGKVCIFIVVNIHSPLPAVLAVIGTNGTFVNGNPV